MDEVTDVLVALANEVPPEMRRLIDVATEDDESALDRVWRELVDEALSED